MMENEWNKCTTPDSVLRRWAEGRSGTDGTPERRKLVAPSVSRQLIHNLRVHQTELEVQNEELRRTQAELDAARRLYFDLYDLAPVGYCTISETEHIQEANLTVCTLLGMSRDNLIGRSIRQFIFPADQDAYYLHRKNLAATGEPQSCELRLVRQDRSQFWASLQGTLTQGPDHHDIHRAVLINIDERKVAEDHLRVSDVARKAVSQGVLITTPQLCVISANQAFLAMSGYLEAELLGADCVRFNGPLTDPVTIAALLKAIEERRHFSCEIINYRKDGSSFWNALAISPVFDEQAALTHFVSINTDISERKALDQLLRDRNAELQRISVIAEKANLAKSDFLSSMSHELRSPLNSILGFAQLLEAGTPAPTPGQQRSIDMILRGGWYLLTLINEILDLALIESGKLALSLEPLSLAQVLEDCRGMVEPQAELKGIKITFPSFTSPLLVVADPTRLKQVIVNLLSNAIKYNRANGAVAVTVSADHEKMLRISVRDTGAGLSPEKVAQLFQPFNRLGQEGTAIEGTGIGLVVTKRLTELMGGTVGAQSEVGVGSVFWVELSGTQEVPHAMDAKQLPRGVSRLKNPSAQTACTILYVEDNPANAQLVEQILADRPNLRLLLAHDGAQGIEMARLHRPNVILMDINLPGINGVEALKVLRSDPATCHIPTVAVSANAMPLDVVKGLSAGFYRYLTKPFKINEFLVVLDMALVFSLDHAVPAKQ